jgi:hypothetical protein
MQGHVVLTLALYHGAGNACLHQDHINITIAKGRIRFARQCQPLETNIIEQDLLVLDAAVRQSLAEEAAQDDAHGPTALPHGSRIAEGSAYFRLQTKPNGTEERMPISSFVIMPKQRVCMTALKRSERSETVTADRPDVTFERHHWFARPLPPGVADI